MKTLMMVGDKYVTAEGLTPPSPAEHFYLAFPIKTREEDAARRFVELYGFHPPWLFDSLGNLLAGPAPAKGVLC